jgi:hypothetical protein
MSNQPDLGKLSKLVLFAICLGSLFISLGCRKSPTPAQAQVLKVAELGSKLDSATEAGLNYSEFRSALLEFVGALDLAVEMWPQDLSQSTKQQLLDSKQVWLFTKNLWGDKVDSARYPDLTIVGMSQSLGESLISTLPEKARKEITLSDGDWMQRAKGDNRAESKHLSYRKIGSALALASEDFVSARKQIAIYLR